MATDAPVQERSRKLYATLGSLMSGKLLRIVMSVPSQNGAEAMRLLVSDMKPRERQRGLGLLQEILDQGAFAADSSLSNERIKLDRRGAIQ